MPSTLLPQRRYQVVHADTGDRRGIDIAFLYDPGLFTAREDQRFQHVVMRRTATREIFQVNLRTAAGRSWAVFGNHWPSRSGGQHESAPYRAIAGETLAYFPGHSPAGCYAKMGDPHRSSHVPGTVNVVARTTCDPNPLSTGCPAI